MVPPKTPSKADDGLNKIVTSLEARWNLQFPVRDSTWSPSKVQEPKPVGEQVLSRLIFLNHKDKDGLRNAIESFEKQAPTIGSRWTFKPRADHDTVPSRLPSESPLAQSFLSHRPPITDAMATELMQLLLHILTLTVDQAKVELKNHRDPHNDTRTSWF